MRRPIQTFNFKPKSQLSGGKYTVVRKLGGGWEGEVYIVRERMIGILRAAKFF